MTPQTQKRKPRNSTKVNLLLSLTFHGIIVVSLLFFAAREGLLGKQVKKIAVEMLKEKPPEKPKELVKPREEAPKLETPKMAEVRKVEEPKEAPQAPPPSVAMAPPVVAPPAVEVPSFEVEGGKAVESSSDPVEIYKSLIESSLRSRWNRPDDLDDQGFVAEVEVAVNASGQIDSPVWKKSSGNKKWDESVRQALASTQGVERPPPPHFPARVRVRFDVVAAEPSAQ